MKLYLNTLHGKHSNTHKWYYYTIIRQIAKRKQCPRGFVYSKIRFGPSVTTPLGKSKNPSTDLKKTQFEFNAITSVLSSTHHGNIKDMTSHAHLQSYVSHSTWKRSHKNVTSCLSVIRLFRTRWTYMIRHWPIPWLILSVLSHDVMLWLTSSQQHKISKANNG